MEYENRFKADKTFERADKNMTRFLEESNEYVSLHRKLSGKDVVAESAEGTSDND